ncbi:hypothetical protein Tco_0586663, partial [Tanacetum coccineum]
MASIRAIILSVSELLLPLSAKAMVFLRVLIFSQVELEQDFIFEKLISLIWCFIEENTTGYDIKNFLVNFTKTVIEDFDNIAFGQIVTMAVSEHFLHTKPIIDFEEFVNVYVRIGFGSAIKLVSFDKSQVVTFNSKFICSFRNSDCRTGSWCDNMVNSPHGFIIYWIEIFENHKKVTEVVDVKNWRIDNSRVLRWVVSLIERNSQVSSTKSLIQSTFRF